MLHFTFKYFNYNYYFKRHHSFFKVIFIALSIYCQMSRIFHFWRPDMSLELSICTRQPSAVRFIRVLADICVSGAVDICISKIGLHAL